MLNAIVDRWSTDVDEPTCSITKITLTMVQAAA